MALFSLAMRTASTTSTQTLMSIVAGANNAYRLLELGLSLNAATACVPGFGQPAVVGTTQSGNVTVLAEDAPNTTAGATVMVPTWTTFPTAPTNYLRRANLPGTVGAGIVWTFPRGRSMLKATQDCVFNIVNAPLSDVWIVVDE